MKGNSRQYKIAIQNMYVSHICKFVFTFIQFADLAWIRIDFAILVAVLSLHVFILMLHKASNIGQSPKRFDKSSN